MNNKITILTDPVIYLRSSIIYSLKRIYLLISSLYKTKYRGHFAVTRSLVNGFELDQVDYNYNPISAGRLNEIVIVLSGVDTLRQSIILKRKGYINKIIAGPNIVEFSSDFNSLIASKEIDLVLTPSEWVAKLYCRDNEILKKKYYSWPAGVDHKYWSPEKCISKKNSGKQILIYNKTKDNNTLALIDKVNKFIIQEGFSVKVMHYGNYNHKEYREDLFNSSLLVGFTNGHESQGIAWVESWSMNIPTLIYGNDINTYRGREFECSTAPYLESDNGAFFFNYVEFKEVFIKWKKGEITYNAREWLNVNMTDIICSLKLYKFITND